ncbi:unnamed protein product [Brachionus calyciflorus]|uniref:Innexin n=1 Tax=Brachionus calyciflorus TaxID=104777 RepID=A0A813NJG9_9BILA|nr:unnamed protein product [Brachionus calyciflorus]
MEIIRGFANLPKITLSTCGRDDDVFVDRLNYKYTTLILFVSSLTITVKILQSDHIQCWVPAILSKYEHYINIYCWISNTYYVSFREQTTSVTNKPERMLKYYQWVPMILLCLAFLFLLPRFMYRFLSKQSGIDMLNLADAAINYMAVEKFDKRRRSLLYLANSIHFYSVCNKSKRTKGGFSASSSLGGPIGSPIVGATSSKPYIYNLMCCHGKINGAYLLVLYMFTKILYILNSFAQLFILNIFLGFNYNSHGFHVLKDVTKGLMSNTNSLSAQRRAEAEAAAEKFAAQLNLNHPGNMPQPILGPTVIFDNSDDQFLGGASNKDGSSFGYNTYSDSIYSETANFNNLLHRYFPRESACDFRIRANIDSLVHNYTVQCVLPINLYNEQLFILLWAWLWLVCIANCYDFLIWVVRILPSSRYNYIRTRLRLKHSENSVKRNLNSFVYDYLTFDGVFVLRIMTLSMSDCVTHEIVQTLWQNFTDTSRGRSGGGGAGSGGAGSMLRDGRAAAYNQRYSSRASGAGGGGSVGNDDYQDNRFISNYSTSENI